MCPPVSILTCIQRRAARTRFCSWCVAVRKQYAEGNAAETELVSFVSLVTSRSERIGD